MTNLQIMKKHLNKTVISPLLAQGFTGKYPHLRREKEGCIELIVFQTNKYGGSFVVEVSAVFPDGENTNFVSWDSLAVQDLTVWNTNERYRLKGMYDGWFYYSDLYRKYVFFWGWDYLNIRETDTSPAVPKGYKLVQSFNDRTAEQVCAEVNKQLVQAFRWLERFEKSNI